MVGSGSVQASNLVAALASRDVEAREPHHRGKGKGNGAGKKNNARQVDEEEDDDAHWADLHTHDFDLETRAPHHKG
ncbi:hypothetical protein HBH86_179810 [Parastagonospora nodorum]|nr:hypothetical protein HBH86_179810 [Parastagonospora nodorum]